MNVTRLAVPAAVGVAAFAVVAGAAFGGYAVHHSATRTVTITRTVTHTAPAKVITKRVTVTGPSSVQCSEVTSGASGSAFLIVGNAQAAGYNGSYEGMCSVKVTPFGSSANGHVTLTDSAGLSTTYDLGTPAAPQSAAGLPPFPHVNGATHSVLVNCAVQQCTSLPGAGPNGGTCGPVVNNEQECVW